MNWVREKYVTVESTKVCGIFRDVISGSEVLAIFIGWMKFLFYGSVLINGGNLNPMD